VVALEVEGKFSIPDERTFQRLPKATSLVGFSLEEPRLAELCDRYLDTADGAFRARGYACRIRRQDSQTLATLTLSPRDWPKSAARDLALHLGIRPVQITPIQEMRQ
jgi:inorganic triphosphatase YgiF